MADNRYAHVHRDLQRIDRLQPDTSLTTRIVVTAVPKANTTTTGSTTTPAVAPGEEVKLKAVVKPDHRPDKPTGTVTFSEGATLSRLPCRSSWLAW